MTVILKDDALRGGGFGEMTYVGDDDDYAYKVEDARISGMPETQKAFERLDEAQLAYKLARENAYTEEVLIIGVNYDDGKWVRSNLTWVNKGNMTYSFSREGETLADCIRAAFATRKVL